MTVHTDSTDMWIGRWVAVTVHTDSTDMWIGRWVAVIVHTDSTDNFGILSATTNMSHEVK